MHATIRYSKYRVLHFLDIATNHNTATHSPTNQVEYMKKIALGISKVDLMPASYFTTFDPYFTGMGRRKFLHSY